MMTTAAISPQSIQHFSQDSKVWIYQSDRPFTTEEQIRLQQSLDTFAMQWTAHNKQLRAAGFLLLDRVVVLMVDETHTTASGCSIDTSVHFMQSVEKEFRVQMFDRMLVNYQTADGWHTAALHDLRHKLNTGEIHFDTPVVNPLVQNKSAFDHGFITPLKDCWIGDFLS